MKLNNNSQTHMNRGLELLEKGTNENHDFMTNVSTANTSASQGAMSSIPDSTNFSITLIGFAIGFT